MNLINNGTIPKKDKQKSFANPFKYLVLIFFITGSCLPVVANDSLDLLKRWKELAAEGNAAAQNALGVRYYLGVGVPKSHKEAAKWYQLSAEQGDVDAQKNLGRLYDQGEGVAQDYQQAIKWYQFAVDQKNEEAQFYLGTIYQTGQGISQNFEKASTLYRLAAEQGYVPAQIKLGKMYWDGKGVQQNFVEAYKWLSLAKKHVQPFDADKRVYEAIEDLDVLTKQLTSSQKEEGQRLALEWEQKNKKE